METWFSNRGQIVQVALAALACLMAGINAWPAIRQLEFLNFAPITFYVVVAAVFVYAVSVRSAPRDKDKDKGGGTSNSTLIGPAEQHWTLKSSFFKLTCTLGSLNELPGFPNPVNLVVTNIEGEGDQLRANLAFSSGGFHLTGGVNVKELGKNKFSMPILRYTCDEDSVFYSLCREDIFLYFSLRVEHINPHAKEVIIAGCRLIGRK